MQPEPIIITLGKKGNPKGVPSNMKITHMGRFVRADQENKYYLIMEPKNEKSTIGPIAFVGNDTAFQKLKTLKGAKTVYKDKSVSIDTDQGRFFFPGPKQPGKPASFDIQPLFVAATKSIFT